MAFSNDGKTDTSYIWAVTRLYFPRPLGYQTRDMRLEHAFMGQFMRTLALNALSSLS